MAKSSKGGAFERDMSKYLSKWVSGEEKPYLFWRSPGSGSVATMTMLNDHISGDIISLKPESEFMTKVFSIELKNGYPMGSMDKHLKYSKADHIKAFWIQCIGDAKEGNRQPMLIFKKKGMPSPWVGISKNVYLLLEEFFEGRRFMHMGWGGELPDLYFFDMHEFFESITPDIIKNNLL